LQLLRRHGQMSAIELSEALEIGAVGIRQHLTALQQNRYKLVKWYNADES